MEILKGKQKENEVLWRKRNEVSEQNWLLKKCFLEELFRGSFGKNVQDYLKKNWFLVKESFCVFKNKIKYRGLVPSFNGLTLHLDIIYEQSLVRHSLSKAFGWENLFQTVCRTFCLEEIEEIFISNRLNPNVHPLSLSLAHSINLKLLNVPPKAYKKCKLLHHSPSTFQCPLLHTTGYSHREIAITSSHDDLASDTVEFRR